MKKGTKDAVLLDLSIEASNKLSSLQKMFISTLTPGQIASLLDDARVDYVECDGVVSIAAKSKEDLR